MKGINNWKLKIIMIMAKHSIVKVVTSVELLTRKIWNPLQFGHLGEKFQEIKITLLLF